MKTDLRNLVTGQEAYLGCNGTYYDGPIPAAGIPLSVSSGVTLTLSDVTSSGWAATATHVAAPDWMCGVFVGAAAPVAPATEERKITCR